MRALRANYTIKVGSGAKQRSKNPKTQMHVN